MRVTGFVLCRARAGRRLIFLFFSWAINWWEINSCLMGFEKEKEEWNEYNSFKKRLSFNLAIINIIHAYRRLT